MRSTCRISRAATSHDANRRAALRLQAQRDVLGLEVLADPLEAALAPEPGLLDPAEGRGGVRDEALVEADHPGLESLGDAEGAREIAGVQVSDEAVLGAIGGLERFVL